jgi:hypothetical protein
VDNSFDNDNEKEQELRSTGSDSFGFWTNRPEPEFRMMSTPTKIKRRIETGIIRSQIIKVNLS